MSEARFPYPDGPKNADEEGVCHSWESSAVQVWVDVDRGIAPMVGRLNKVPGLRTYASCQGRRLSRVQPKAYVSVGWKHETTFRALLALVGTIDGASFVQDAPHGGVVYFADRVVDQVLHEYEQASA